MKRKKLHIKQILLSWSILLTVIAILLFWYGEKKINPMLKSVIVNAGQSYATDAVEQAVNELLSSNQYKSDDIIKITYNSSGEVKSVNCDYVKINLLKSDISLNAQKKISEKANIPVSVPLGMLTGSELLKNTGPEIPLDTYITGGVVTDFKSELKDAGVNQCLYTVTAVIKGDISVYSTSLKADTSIETSLIVAQTLIVGTPPDLVWNNEL